MLYLMLFLSTCFIVHYINSVKKEKSHHNDFWFANEPEVKPEGDPESNIA